MWHVKLNSQLINELTVNGGGEVFTEGRVRLGHFYFYCFNE